MSLFVAIPLDAGRIPQLRSREGSWGGGILAVCESIGAGFRRVNLAGGPNGASRRGHGIAHALAWV